MNFESVSTAFASVVPTGKSLAWIMTAGGAMFFAGVGFTLSANEWSQLPETVTTLKESETRQDAAIRRLELNDNVATRDRRKILCLVELQTQVQATGEALSPLEYNNRLATCENPPPGAEDE